MFYQSAGSWIFLLFEMSDVDVSMVVLFHRQALESDSKSESEQAVYTPQASVSSNTISH